MPNCVCVCAHVCLCSCLAKYNVSCFMIRKWPLAQVSWLVNLTHKQNGTWEGREGEHSVSAGGEVIVVAFIMFYLWDYVWWGRGKVCPQSPRGEKIEPIKWQLRKRFYKKRVRRDDEQKSFSRKTRGVDRCRNTHWLQKMLSFHLHSLQFWLSEAPLLHTQAQHLRRWT